MWLTMLMMLPYQKTTAEDRYPTGAKKFAQIGQSGWNAIFNALFDKMELPARAVIMIVVASVLWGACNKELY